MKHDAAIATKTGASSKRGLFWCGLLLLAGVAAACRPEPTSNFGVEGWAGRTLAGERVAFRELTAPAVILNVYSPTCGPCIEEIPALTLYHERARAAGIPMYIVLTAEPADHGLNLAGSLTFQARFQAIAARVAEDVRRYRIEIPMLIMEDGFRVSTGDGLITGTPETLLFHTKPLALTYNFIGPLSVSQNPADILRESRFSFALQQLDRIRASAAPAAAY